MERPNSTLELAGQDEAAQAPELVEHDETAGAPELVKYDETTRAPEYDCDATAFELDSSVLAPQASKTCTRQEATLIQDIGCTRHNTTSALQ